MAWYHLYTALALSCVAGTFGFSSSGRNVNMPAFAAPMQLRTSISSSHALSTASRPVVAGKFGKTAGRIQRAATTMMAYGADARPKATKELLQVRFVKPDPEALMAFIQKWPAGTAKDKYGLPKLMLPVTWEKLDDGSNQGLKVIFKGSLDPWLQIQIEGDTVRVYRCSGLATTSLQVSALKEREEGKICDKLKTDLNIFGETKQVEIPVIKPKVEEPAETEASTEDKEESEAAPPS